MEGVVLNANVEIVFQSENNEPIIIKATHENATIKFFYEADTELSQEGIWEITTNIIGTKGDGNATFNIEVAPPRKINWGIIGSISIISLILVYMAWSYKKNNSNLN